MKYKISILISILLLFSMQNFAQKTDANIVGHVVCCGEHIPFATILVKGTTIGTSTDETGHYTLLNLPVGKNIIRAQAIGYRPQEKEILINADETKEIKFSLLQDVLGLEQVVITADRNEKNRQEASVIVNTITPKMFEVTQSVTVCDGLNFSPGLRTENDCQNCGFTQLRINGMEGAYSQILINNRAIFSGLAGVYGLELLPSSIINRIEVIRGGGSALYGSNAIAGTVNLITKDPINNTYEVGINTSVIGVGLKNSGNPAQDNSINFNTSIVSPDHKTGISVFGFYRNRQAFDANNDSFSEISKIKNTTIGTRAFHRFGPRSKFIADFFHIDEFRRGGDKFDYPAHEAGIAEVIQHNINTGALTYEKYVRECDLFSVFVSGQVIDRDSYYGADYSLKDYGKTNDFTFTIGTQYKAVFSSSNLIVGLENEGGFLKDQKLGYPVNSWNADSTISISHTENTTVADQNKNSIAFFIQYEYDFEKLKLSCGLRYDHYNISDNISDGDDISGDVFSPRINVLYDIEKFLQARLSYSQGFRAPQIFDEDLHIETSGLRRIIHKNKPDLKQETSHSFTASLDFSHQTNIVNWEILVESFYTQLNNPFANEFGVPDENGTVIYTRVNAAEGAKVYGVNLEFNFVPSPKLFIKSGFTIQKSEYKNIMEFNEKRFLRSPENYGFMSLRWSPIKKMEISTSANYTGKMLVPYFGLNVSNPDEGELHESDLFFDFGAKISYSMKLNGASLKIYTGIKNILNSYQSDFDSGIYRDPGYVYGPSLPRTIYFGLNIGNFFD